MFEELLDGVAPNEQEEMALVVVAIVSCCCLKHCSKDESCSVEILMEDEAPVPSGAVVASFR